MISQQESNSVTIIRTFSMFMIVICHLFQAYNHSLAAVFNVGVQVFFIISGFLYGHKNVSDWNLWYKKRLLKLYIPYIIVAFSVMLIHIIAETANVRWYNIVGYITNLHGLRQVIDIPLNVSGLNHLWFMTAIMFAYIATPIAQYLKKNSFLFLSLMLSVLAPIYLYLPPKLLWGLEWVWLYMFGYFFANISSKQRTLVGVAFIIAFIIILPYIHSEADIANYSRMGRISHCALGVTIFYLGLLFFKGIKNVPRFILFFDKHSFYIFLAHFPLMVGSLSLSQVTSNNYVNVALMIIASAFSTILLEFSSKKISKLF